jgi:hypothetical protein
VQQHPDALRAWRDVKRTSILQVCHAEVRLQLVLLKQLLQLRLIPAAAAAIRCAALQPGILRIYAANYEQRLRTSLHSPAAGCAESNPLGKKTRGMKQVGRMTAVLTARYNTVSQQRPQPQAANRCHLCLFQAQVLAIDQHCRLPQQ